MPKATIEGGPSVAPEPDEPEVADEPAEEPAAAEEHDTGEPEEDATE